MLRDKCLRIIQLIVCIGLFSCVAFSQHESLFEQKVLANANLRDLSALCDRKNAVSERVLREYGSMFLTSATLPGNCVYKDEAEVTAFQQRAGLSVANIGGVRITLQESAFASLNAAIDEAKKEKLNITPRGGKIAGTRSYADTSRLWTSRFTPALNYWQKLGRISREDADDARSRTPYEQVPIVLAWESEGMFFSTGFSRTILSSVAAPGTSQHLSGLALDVAQFNDPRIRAILSRHGWFQTVVADQPHFTYLGLPESELSGLGLKTVMRGGYKYWVPAF